MKKESMEEEDVENIPVNEGCDSFGEQVFVNDVRNEALQPFKNELRNVGLGSFDVD